MVVSVPPFPIYEELLLSIMEGFQRRIQGGQWNLLISGGFQAPTGAELPTGKRKKCKPPLDKFLNTPLVLPISRKKIQMNLQNFENFQFCFAGFPLSKFVNDSRKSWFRRKKHLNILKANCYIGKMLFRQNFTQANVY